MDKLSEGITSAFNTAGTEANKAKLQTEIAMKQHQIKGIKQEFGVRPVHETKSGKCEPIGPTGKTSDTTQKSVSARPMENYQKFIIIIKEFLNHLITKALLLQDIIHLLRIPINYLKN